MEAVNTVAPKKTRKHYTPPACIAEVEGVNKRTELWADAYSGTKEQLVKIGILSDGLFPGDAGMPASSVTLWPAGVLRGGSWTTPGVLRVARNPSGKFCATLTVSAEEQASREAKDEAKRAAQKARYEAAEKLRKAERQAGASLQDIIETLELTQVITHVDRLRRASKPPRAAGHLRVVWSAPAP